LVVKPPAFIAYAERQAVALFSHLDPDLFRGILSVSMYNSVGNGFGQADQYVRVQIRADSVSRYDIVYIDAYFGYIFNV
jgi:hypothetical protein